MDRIPTLAGRALVVTGGARRLGAAITRHLASRGARLAIVHSASARAAAQLLGELGAGGETAGAHVAVQLDLAAPDSGRELFARLDAAGFAPDGLVHAAASFLHRGVLETTVEEWDATFALNLRSFFLTATELARRRGGRGGDLVAIADAAALELWSGYVAHAVSKAALLALVRALAKSLAPGFRVNAVIPGPVLPPDGTPPEELERMRRRTLLERLGRPENVAETVEFLLTNDYVTGAAIEVTGGSTLWRGSA